MELGIIILWILVILVWYLFKLSYSNENYFKDKNVAHDKPLPIVGNIWDFVLRRRNMQLILNDLYKKYKHEKFFGFFNMRNPMYVFCDPDLIKQITIKDFDHFVDHANFLNPKIDPLFGRMMPFLKGQKWKDTRSIMSPVFTSSKMKMMMNSLSNNARDFTLYFEDELKKADRVLVNGKEVFSKFTINGISNCVFGMATDSLRNANNEFYNDVRKLINVGLITNFKFFLANAFPRLYALLGIRILAKKSVEFAQRITIDAIKYRKENKIVRSDVLQLLMEANDGNLKYEESTDDSVNFSAHKEYITENRSGKRGILSDMEVTAQGFIFFFAGFETTSNLLNMAAYELAKNPDIQQELANEIDEVNRSLEGKSVTYEIIHSMKFLDMVVSETLRKWPPGPQASNRSISKTYTLTTNDGTKVTLEPGDNLFFPIIGLHYDEDYWPDPKRFDPYRFSDENKHKIHAGTYLPFGIGPRSCIGSRFALLETKVLFYYFFLKLKVKISEKTPEKVEFESTIPPILKKPMMLEIVKR